MGICGAEDALNSDIKSMLAKIEVIDECDTFSEKLDAENTIHKVSRAYTSALDSTLVSD